MPITVSLLGFLSDETYASLQSSEALGQVYSLRRCSSRTQFLTTLQQETEIDILVLEEGPELPALAEDLRQQSLLFPALILSTTPSKAPAPEYYHPAETNFILSSDDREVSSRPLPERFSQAIDQSMQQFLSLSPSMLSGKRQEQPGESSNFLSQAPLALQDRQKELKNKLQERLGYLGIYYKRDPRQFLRNLSEEDAAEVVKSLQQQYQVIVLNYFKEDADLNPLIDEFVNLAFFTDLSVTKIVEIHMELMDDYAKQLKLEGRGEEILVDYRLTLLDIVSHLCEMYRRSIPREA